MINDLNITNFKSLRGVHLNDFGVVNVIVGDNGSGKTSLLEAIFLAEVGSPEVVLRLRIWRSMGSSLAVSANRDSYESIWRNLFAGFDQSKTIEIRAKGDSETARVLKLY